MNEKFFDLKKDKQDRMINGALKVFAQNGYQKASTDDIVKEAGISKGLLFHYFGSKAGTYIFVYEFSARFMSMEIERAVSLREKDLFILLEQVNEAKTELLRKYPYMEKFLLTHVDIKDETIQKAVSDHINVIPKALSGIIGRADSSRIIDGVDFELLVRSMVYANRGLMETALMEGLDPDYVEKEAHAYYEMMRKQYTKPEYLLDI